MSEQRVIIDYFTCSWKTNSYAEGMDIFRLFRLPDYDPRGDFFGSEGFDESPSYFGLESCYKYKGVNVHVGSDLVILDISGKGCRTVEREFNWNWEDFFDSLQHDLTHVSEPGLPPKAHISRLDVACDVFDDDQFTVDRIYDYVRRGKVACKAKSYLYGEGTDEHWIYYGSSRSERRLRIYDKSLEQKRKGSTDPEADRKWVRVELQLRNICALSFVLNYYKIRQIPECYYGVLYDFLRVTKNVLTDSTMTDLNLLFFGNGSSVGSVNLSNAIYLNRIARLKTLRPM